MNNDLFVVPAESAFTIELRPTLLPVRDSPADRPRLPPVVVVKTYPDSIKMVATARIEIATTCEPHLPFSCYPRDKGIVKARIHQLLWNSEIQGTGTDA